MTSARIPSCFRQLVIRAWWDGQEHPSIECPLGDFMGSPHNRIVAYQSAVHSDRSGQNAALNFWLPMPFRSAARIALENESDQNCNLYYQVDYTAGDSHPRDVGRMHALFRRETPTTLREDFEILPMRHGKGRYMGAVLGVRFDDPQWWGEGEVKMYIDGGRGFPDDLRHGVGGLHLPVLWRAGSSFPCTTGAPSAAIRISACTAGTSGIRGLGLGLPDHHPADRVAEGARSEVHRW